MLELATVQATVVRGGRAMGSNRGLSLKRGCHVLAARPGGALQWLCHNLSLYVRSTLNQSLTPSDSQICQHSHLGRKITITALFIGIESNSALGLHLIAKFFPLLNVTMADQTPKAEILKSLHFWKRILCTKSLLLSNTPSRTFVNLSHCSPQARSWYALLSYEAAAQNSRAEACSEQQFLMHYPGQCHCVRNQANLGDSSFTHSLQEAKWSPKLVLTKKKTTRQTHNHCRKQPLMGLYQEKNFQATARCLEENLETDQRMTKRKPHQRITFLLTYERVTYLPANTWR